MNRLPRLRTRLSLIALASFSLLAMTHQAFAGINQNLAWKTFAPDTGTVNDYGVYNQTNSVILPEGDLVQLIWVGPNGQIDTPLYTGAPGGDDVLLDTNTVKNTGFPPPYLNHGFVPSKDYTYDSESPQAGGTLFIRSWDHPTAGGYNGATFYGHSQTFTMTGVLGETFNALRWPTNLSATLPEIEVARGATPLTDGSSTVAYGTTLIGNPITYTFTITNSGVDALTLSNLSVPTGFSVVQTFGTTSVGSLATTTFKVALTAVAPGDFSGTLSFDNNDANENPFNFTVTGRVIAPEIAVRDGATDVPDGGSVDYGTTLLNTPITKTFTISNTGTADLTLSNLTVPSGFSVVVGLGSPTTLISNTTTTIQVALTAVSPGPFSGSLSFTTNDANENPFNFTVSGTVVAPEIAVRDGGTILVDGVSTASFGTTLAGAPIAKSFFISNTGTADLTLSNLTVPTGYTVLSGLGSPTTVSAGQATSITIQLNAADPGTFTGTVQFNNNDADENPFNFNVTGTAIDPEIVVRDGATNIADGTAVVSFGSTPFGTPVTKTFTISNTGTAALNLSNLMVPTGFTVVNGLGNPTTVSAGTAVTIQISMDGSPLGNPSGSLSFTTNDRDENPFNFTVMGHVVAPEIAVRDGATPIATGGSVDYGTTLMGTPITKTFTISNTGTADLTLANLTVPTGFSIVVGLGNPTTVISNSTTTIQVSLAAVATGPYSGTLSFDTNDSDENPFTFTVNGTVVSPEIGVWDGATEIVDGVSTVAYGTTIGGIPVTKTFTISNTGTADLNLSDLTVPAGYTVLSGLGNPTTVSAGQTTSITISLNAINAGVFNGTIQFTTDDLDENPFNFDVTATVLDPEIVVRDGATNIADNTGNVNFGTTLLNTAVVKTFTISNTGTADLTLSDLTVPTGFTILTGLGNPTTVSAGTAVTIQIQLDGSPLGNPSGTLSFTTNDRDENPFNFTISGSVVAVPTPEIEVEHDLTLLVDGLSTVDFGSTTAGTPVIQTFTVRNTGNGNLTLSALTVPTGFAIEANFGDVDLAPAEETTFAVRLNAASLGTLSGQVSFTNNDGDENPFNFNVEGSVTAALTPEVAVTENGVDIFVNDTVDFGQTAVGTAVVKTFTVNNTGSQTLTVGLPTVPAGYTLLTTPASTLGAGASTNFQVQLDATAVGTFAGNVSFATNDADENPFTFAVTAEVQDNTPIIYLPFVVRN